MNATLTWYDPEQSILYLRLEGEWEMVESRRIIDEYKQHLGAAIQRVDLIAHAVDKAARRPPVWVLRLGVYGVISSPANTGLIVMVPTSPVMLALADAGSYLLGKHYRGKIRTAETVDEAQQIIKMGRAS